MLNSRLQSHSAYIRTALRDISDPAIGRVAHAFCHSQIADLQIRNIVHGNLKTHIDRSTPSDHRAWSIQSDLGASFVPSSQTFMVQIILPRLNKFALCVRYRCAIETARRCNGMGISTTTLAPKWLLYFRTNQNRNFELVGFHFFNRRKDAP
jgi:hypothetical protein